jgi:hypothetical protein
MRYKDLGFVLLRAKKAAIPLRIHEMLYLTLQIAESIQFLEQVRKVALISAFNSYL